MATDKQSTRDNKKEPINLRVYLIENCSNNIKRFIFSDTSKKLQKTHESGYLKLQFYDKSGNQVKRSFTIREVDEKNNIVIIDFVTHETYGPASSWAANAKIGDIIIAYGPGPTKLVEIDYPWYVIVGDMTSLPAIAVNLKILPPNSKGSVIIEVGDESDIQSLEYPKSIEIEWVLNKEQTDIHTTILEKVANKTISVENTYIWVASEFQVAKSLRNYFKKLSIPSSNRYISSYWKRGESDEGNKVAQVNDGGF